MKIAIRKEGLSLLTDFTELNITVMSIENYLLGNNKWDNTVYGYQ